MTITSEHRVVELQAEIERLRTEIERMKTNWAGEVVSVRRVCRKEVIEECALVVEELSNQKAVSYLTMAAAIRALKDES